MVELFSLFSVTNFRTKEMEMSRTTTTGISGNVVAQNLVNNVHVGRDVSDSSPSKEKTFRLIQPPTSLFIDRREQDILEKLKQACQSCPISSLQLDRIVVLIGPPGTGKSELIRTFAAKYIETLPNVAWIEASSKESIEKSFEQLARLLLNTYDWEQQEEKLKSSRDKGFVIRTAAYKKFENYPGNWLLVFANAPRLRANSYGHNFGIYDYLPQFCLFPKKHLPLVLITSDSIAWDREIRSITLPELSQPEMLGFLKKYFELAEDDFKNLEPLLVQISYILQGHALTLTLFASSMDFIPSKDSTQSLTEKLLNYISTTEEVPENVRIRCPEKYIKGLFAAWKTLLVRINTRELGPAALEALFILSYLPHAGTTLDQLEATVQFTSDSNLLSSLPREVVREVIWLLNKFQLITVDVPPHVKFQIFPQSEFIKIHPLVQELARSEDAASPALQKVLRSFVYRLSSGDFDVVFEDTLRLATMSCHLNGEALTSFLFLSAADIFFEGLKEKKLTVDLMTVPEVAEPFGRDMLWLVQGLVKEANRNSNVDEVLVDILERENNWNITSYERALAQLTVMAFVHKLMAKPAVRIQQGTTVRVANWLAKFVTLEKVVGLFELTSSRLNMLFSIISSLLKLNSEEAFGPASCATVCICAISLVAEDNDSRARYWYLLREVVAEEKNHPGVQRALWEYGFLVVIANEMKKMRDGSDEKSKCLYFERKESCILDILFHYVTNPTSGSNLLDENELWEAVIDWLDSSFRRITGFCEPPPDDRVKTRSFSLNVPSEHLRRFVRTWDLCFSAVGFGLVPAENFFRKYFQTSHMKTFRDVVVKMRKVYENQIRIWEGDIFGSNRRGPTKFLQVTETNNSEGVKLAREIAVEFLTKCKPYDPYRVYSRTTDGDESTCCTS